jgi:hypothetical protein
MTEWKNTYVSSFRCFVEISGNERPQNCTSKSGRYAK